MSGVELAILAASGAAVLGGAALAAKAYQRRKQRKAEEERQRREAAAPPPAPGDEQRIDPQDGRAHARSEFESVYGADAGRQWAEAQPARSPEDDAHAPDTFVVEREPGESVGIGLRGDLPIIESIDPEGAAARGGIPQSHRGRRVVSVNGAPVRTAADVVAAMEASPGPLSFGLQPPRTVDEDTLVLQPEPGGPVIGRPGSDGEPEIAIEDLPRLPIREVYQDGMRPEMQDEEDTSIGWGRLRGKWRDTGGNELRLGRIERRADRTLAQRAKLEGRGIPAEQLEAMMVRTRDKELDDKLADLEREARFEKEQETRLITLEDEHEPLGLSWHQTDERTVAVHGVIPGSACARAGVKPGTLYSIGGVRVRTKEDVANAVRRIREAGLTVFDVVVVPQSAPPAPVTPEEQMLAVLRENLASARLQVSELARSKWLRQQFAPPDAAPPRAASAAPSPRGVLVPQQQLQRLVPPVVDAPAEPQRPKPFSSPSPPPRRSLPRAEQRAPAVPRRPAAGVALSPRQLLTPQQLTPNHRKSLAVALQPTGGWAVQNPGRGRSPRAP